ncbi:hypothetical protein ABK040_006024 [Willaertia magna]
MKQRSFLQNQPFDDVVMVECVPSVVVFPEYEVGHCYQEIVQIKNKSKYSTLIRITRPKTKFFKIQRLDEKEHKIAPGMSVKVLITFSPDSLLDFDDSIEIVTASKKNVILPLRGRRRMPLLTIPRIIDCGYCVVNGEINHIIECVNKGGVGKFLLLKHFDEETMNPTLLFSSVNEFQEISETILECPPFFISPKHFELQEGEEIPITITYRPETKGLHCVTIFMVFDNQQIFELELRGYAQYPSLELCSISKLSRFDPDNHPSLIQFDNVYPNQISESQSITYLNTTNIVIPYEWKYFDELTEVPIQMKGINLPFSIIPESGEIMPGEKIIFEVTFSPQIVGVYSGFFLLYIFNLPLPNERHPLYLYSRVGLDWFRTSTLNAVQQNDPLKFFVPLSEEKLQIESSSALQSKRNAITKQDISIIGSFMVSHVRVYGSSNTIDVGVNVPLVDFGDVFAGEVVEKKITLYNNSDIEALYRWIPIENETELVVEVSEEKGVIPPRREIDTTIFVTASKAGVFHQIINCEISGINKLPIILKGISKFYGLRLDCAAIDFGIVEAGKKVFIPIQISNPSNVEVAWKLLFSNSNQSDFILDCSPNNEVLLPRESRVVNISLFAEKPCHVREIIQCQDLSGVSQLFISVNAEVQAPLLVLSEYVFELGEIKVNDVVERSFTIKNASFLNVSFSWFVMERYQANSNNNLVIRFKDNESGDIKAYEELDITFQLVAQKPSPKFEALIPCFLQGDKKKYVGMKIKGSII